MKKITIILTVLIAMTIKTNAQIPNSGFENWIPVGNSMEPTSWHSMYSLIDSTGTYCPVTKSTNHYPTSVGSFSVRIANDTALWNTRKDTALWNTGIPPAYLLGWGILISTKNNDEPLFPVIGSPTSLCGYYKFLPQNGDTMNIDYYFSHNGVEVGKGSYISTVAATNWTPFQISWVPNTFYTGIIDSARISLSPSNEPKNGGMGPRGNSVLYVDNLSFDNIITSISEQTVKNTSFSLYPNPAFDIVTLNIDNSNNTDITFNIYNLMGELISSELFQKNQQKINIKNLNNGIYLVEIKSKEWSEKQKLIIQR